MGLLMNVAFRPCVITSVALVGASVICMAPGRASVPAVDVPDVRLIADEEPITLDLVRHGETVGSNSIVASDLPGPPLDETGQQQAQALATLLAPQGPYAGIYAGENIRMPETVQPLADQLGMDVQQLPGLDEISPGVYNHVPPESPAGILYFATLASWVLGLDSVQMPGSDDFNGVAFDENFSNAVQTIYDNTVSEGGPTIDVAASGGAAITIWTLMNVNNPDLPTLVNLFLDQLSSGKGVEPLPEGGIVVVRGDPEDGWTLVSFNGHPFPQDPGLLTELFVDVRNVITAPQIAEYHIFEALLGGDPTTIGNAIQAGVENVGKALLQFPGSVINDIVGELEDGAGGTAGQATDDTVGSLIP
jgi:broad specificity phosphatase PhoE